MKNFEYWEKEIKEVVMNNKPLAVVDGKPCSCHDVACSKCAFDHDINDEIRTCEAKTFEWLYGEHIEQPKISERTKKFFETIETGWVARDYDGSLFIFEIKPHKDHADFQWDVHRDDYDNDDYNMRTLNDYPFNFLTLDFIKWEDEEPWRVEDILKLEVEG